MTRYLAQRIGTGEWIDRDLPLSGVERTRTLSGPSVVTAVVSPELRNRFHTDGLKVLEEWGTFIYAATDDLSDLRMCGIFTDATYEETGLQANCPGFSTYVHGYIYTDAFSWGPAYTPTEEGWLAYYQGQIDYWQSQVASTLELQEGAPDDPGIAATLASQQASLEVAVANYDAYLAFAIDAAMGRRPDPVVIYQDLWAWVQAQADSDVGVTFTGSLTSGLKIGTLDEPFRLRWFEVPDVGAVADDLAAQSPFDYVEEVTWADAAKQTVDKRIRIGFPRLGTARTDLRFVVGENIVEPLTVVSTATSFSNDVIGVGGGEGSTMVYSRSSAGASGDGRLRRHRVVTDKAAGQAQMDSLIMVIAERSKAPYDIASVVISDHPNAPISAVNLGDDILVQGFSPALGDVGVWVRVLAIAENDETPGRATLSTSRSSRFLYAPGVEVSE